MSTTASNNLSLKIVRAAGWIILFILPFLGFGYGLETYRILSKSTLTSARWLAFFAGCGLFIPVWVTLRRFAPNSLIFFTTLEHEFTHLIVGLIFFKSPVALKVSVSEGGHVVLKGNNIWITLAPYYLPTLPLLLFSLGLWWGRHPGIFITLGLTFSYHVLTTWREVGTSQPDLRKSGLLRCLLLLPAASLFFYGLVLAYVSRGYPGLYSFCRNGISNAITSLHYLFSLKKFLMIITVIGAVRNVVLLIVDVRKRMVRAS